MEISRKWRFSCLLLGLFLLATTLQGVQGEVESEGPSESECRPYIEKALKELETAEAADHIDPGAQSRAKREAPDDSDTGEDDTETAEKIESSETEQGEGTADASAEQAASEQEGDEEGEKEVSGEEEGTAAAAESAEEEAAEEPQAESQESQQDVEQDADESQEGDAEAAEEEGEDTAAAEEGEEPVEETHAESQEQADEAEEETESHEQEEAKSEEQEDEEAAKSQEHEETEDTEEAKTESEEAAGESAEKDEAEVAQEDAAESAETSKETAEDAASTEDDAASPEEGAAGSAEEGASASVEEAAASSEDAAGSAEDAAASTEDAAASTEDAAASTEDAAASTEDAAASEEEAAEGAAASTEDAAESTEEAAASAEEAAGETAASAEEAAASAEEAAASVEDAAASAEDAAASPEDAAASTEDAATSSEDAAASAEDAAASAEDTAASAEDAAASAEDAAASAEDAAASPEDAAASAEDAAASTEDAAASTEEEAVEKAEVADVGAASEEGEASKEEAPEEELTMDIDIPENLRSRDHVNQLLKLDDVEAENTLNRISEVTLRELKRLYESAIKPLETLYKYRDLSNRHFGDSEIFSKPLIVFMGPWSGGKSSIINYLTDNEYNATSLRTGAEPSPAYFNLLMYGDEPEVLDGTQLAADFTFAGLQKFGQGLEERLRGLKLPSKLLEKINIVEIPGILEVRKQVSRVFPFNDACQWFIDRADIIFLVYDPSKLDVGPETEAILDQLKGREHQTRIILNKADQVKPEELMRVQGALIWNISPLMSSAQPPVMYTTSLWSRPYETWAPVKLLQAQERAFLRDLRSAVDKRIENKISSARRFAVRVRNHAKMVDCYLTTYYNHKSVFGNRKQVADQIIEHPQDYHIYEGLSTLTNISRYDLPDPDVYRDFFRLNPLYDFQQLSATCTYFRGCPINRLDVAIAYDLPEMVGKHKKLFESALAETKTES